jgi:hypothetical protein
MLKFSNVLYFDNIRSDNNVEKRFFIGSKTLENRNMVLCLKKATVILSECGLLMLIINGSWLSIISLAQPIIEKTLIFFYVVGIQVDKHFSLPFKEF